MKKVSKSCSGWKCHLGSLLNKREGRSVIEFWLPSMCSIFIGQTFWRLNLRARTRISCSATRLDRHAMRCTQLTLGLLLLNSAIRFSARGLQTCSIISHKMTSPATFRSEFVIVPQGFESDTTFYAMSGGHCTRNTVGGHSNNSSVMIPPALWLEASTTPTKSGHPATNS